MRSGLRLLALATGLWLAAPAVAGFQSEEALAASVAAGLRQAVTRATPPRLVFDNAEEDRAWLLDMSGRLARRVPDNWMRERLLTVIHYEASRAGLDPALVLGLIEVESGFRKYAISPVGARGLMQVMPFWVGAIGAPDHNLFDVTTNLRYGCVILRHYLARENGNLYRALGRYNGSLGPTGYPEAVLGAMRRWQ